MKESSVPLEINDTKIQAVVDTASSDSYINEDLAKQLKLRIKKGSRNVTLANSSASAQTIGTARVDMMVNGRKYEDFEVTIMRELCTDMLVGIDFLKKHESIEMKYNGDLPKLSFQDAGRSEDKTCSLIQADVEPQSLFLGLS